MEREERLCYCKVCEFRKMDLKRGIVCQYTNEYADFEITCDKFSGDEAERLRLTHEHEQEKHSLAEAQELLKKESNPLRIVFSLLFSIVLLAFSLYRCSKM